MSYFPERFIRSGFIGLPLEDTLLTLIGLLGFIVFASCRNALYMLFLVRERKFSRSYLEMRFRISRFLGGRKKFSLGYLSVTLYTSYILSDCLVHLDAVRDFVTAKDTAISSVRYTNTYIIEWIRLEQAQLLTD